ncbi:MAG: EamA family transporter [Chloroflexi bacterium]|nr:EamA family transporter [Chloroflexota bacterium]
MNSAAPAKPVIRFSSVDLWVIFLVTVWGVNYVLLKRATGEMGALGFNGLRFTLGTLIMIAVWWVMEPRSRIRRQDLLKLVALGVVGNTGYQLFFIFAIRYSTASNVALMVATGPIWIALLSWALRLDRLTPRAWLGIVLSFAGLFTIISADGNIDFGGDKLTGDLLAVGGAIAWAIYTVLSRPLLARYSSITYTTWTMAAGAPVVLLAGVPELTQTNFAAISWATWGTLVFSATLAISLGYVIWNAGVHRIGQARTATYGNLAPIIALAVSALMLAEPVPLLKLIGAAVVLAGVTLTRRG